MTYSEQRKDLIYYKAIKEILSVIDKQDKKIIDVGSNGVDLISNLQCCEKISVCLSEPINNEFVTGYKTDFFDFNIEKKFDIITCLQVIEHVEKAEEFTQKLFATGKTVIISLPYKWSKNACKYHCQDPIDEKKIFGWTKKQPDFTLYCTETNNIQRIICIYNSDPKDKNKLKYIEKKYKLKSLKNRIKIFLKLILFS